MGKRKRKTGTFSNKKNRNLLLICGIALIVLALLVIAAASLNMNFQLTVNGGAEQMTLVYGKDTYQEPGARATADGKEIPVQITGSVDMSKIGAYEIKYQARYLWMRKTITRMVLVADTTAPVITLKTVQGYLPLPGEQYQEEGYTAVDDYDGDITDKVQVRTENDVVYYTVSDSSGNETTVQRKIEYTDLTAPVLTLKGETKITIDAGIAYAEPGYTATDNIDGDITDKVEISGSVNIYHAGTYTLTYSIKDQHGNVTKAERTVVVKAIKQPATVTPDGKVIYLTFDDGPAKHTKRLLELLDQYNAKATFFVVNTGYNMKTMLNAIVDGGHGLGIHSVSHKYEEIYASEEAFFKDLRKMQDIIKNATGVTTTLMRFPGGSSNKISRQYCTGIMTRLTKAVTDQGFQYFDWNVSSGDAGSTKDSAQVAANVIQGVSGKKYAVVLQHDIHSYSVDAVEQILIWGIQNGYTFQALTPDSPTCHHTVNN